MDKQNCWVWFKGSIDEKGYWKEGFICRNDEGPGLLIESPGFVTCRVPEWRVSIQEPVEIHTGPEIPEGAKWKII
mgnify:CR=1 FL=1|tara:strand:+ start:7832 stop:8056 length:225 start_codon:yes stop_codon:yes gene_type:complete